MLAGMALCCFGIPRWWNSFNNFLDDIMYPTYHITSWKIANDWWLSIAFCLHLVSLLIVGNGADVSASMQALRHFWNFKSPETIRFWFCHSLTVTRPILRYPHHSSSCHWRLPMTLGYPISVTHPLQIDDNFRGLSAHNIPQSCLKSMPTCP
jgi:hypothetical protein